MRALLAAVVAVAFTLLEAVGVRAQPPAPVTLVSATAEVRNIPYVDAKPVIEALRADLLPEELRWAAQDWREFAWTDWVTERDHAIRARLARGDENSAVNFLLFGTTFTDGPRPTQPDLVWFANGSDELPSTIAARIDDFVVSVASPDQNERLQLARSVVERNGIDPDTAEGQDQLRRFLTEGVRRVQVELADISQALQAAIQQSDPTTTLIERTAFRDRGLSSDTSILIDFAIERMLEAAKANDWLPVDGVRRVGLIGPGFDFTDKDQGYDFYPQQSIQPFALIDSLIGLGLARSDRIDLTTFDLNPRINQHFVAARERARAGRGYRLVFPRNMDMPWIAPLVAYWERLGSNIADLAQDVAVPPNAGNVRVRAVEVRPDVVLSIVPQDVNIVLQRLEPLTIDERFDLIVATNVLSYYDVFEQSLALVNVAKMLRPGGLLLSNNAVFTLPGIPMSEVGRFDMSYIPIPGVGEVRD